MDIITSPAPVAIDPITGKEYPAWLSVAVDELVYKIRKRSLWDVVDFCLLIWKTKYPKEHNEYLKEMREYKANRKNKYASTKTNVYREVVILPREVNYLLDKFAADKIADYGPKKFWRNFARRYPVLSPAETI
jgi:hypothetical protein